MAQKAKKASRPKKAAPKARAKKAAPRKSAAKKAAKKKVSPVPPGYHTVTPHLVQADCAAAIAFYKAAFGAKERMRMPGPGGKTMHAEISVEGSVIMMNDEMPGMPNDPGVYKSPKAAGFATGGVFLYVKDVDKAFDRAVKAGATVRMPPMDMFWGDRFCAVIDPHGHTWSMATHKEDLTPKQMAKRSDEFHAQMAAPHGGQA